MPATTIIELPVGFDAQANIVRDAEIRRFKGRVQKDVAELASKKNPDPAEILEAVLAPNWLSSGGSPVSTARLLKAYLADRDYVLFQLIKLTRGNLLTTTDECPHPKCGELVEIAEVNIDEFPVTVVPDEWDLWWAQGNKVVSAEELSRMGPEELKNINGRAFSITSEELGVDAVFRFPTGREQRAISGLGKKLIEAAWKLMAMTCISWKDPDHEIPVVAKGGLKTTFWNDVDLEIVEWLEEVWQASQPGVDSRIDVTCPHCGHEYKTVIGALDFLFQGSRKKNGTDTE